MTDKTKTLTAGGVMLAAQTVVAWAAWLSAWCMARNWSEGLDSVALPLPTDIALRHALVIPTVSAILTVIVVALALRRGHAETQWLLSVAVAEILALALFAVAITMPALTITYRMGP
jgi:hypothetical protein